VCLSYEDRQSHLGSARAAARSLDSAVVSNRTPNMLCYVSKHRPNTVCAGWHIYSPPDTLFGFLLRHQVESRVSNTAGSASARISDFSLNYVPYGRLHSSLEAICS
jgi:hypothetical protein